MNRLQRAAVLTKLVKELRKSGSWCGETHIQKAVYLLQELAGMQTGFSFVLYKHGPYSFELGDELTSLRADGLLTLEPQELPYRPRMSAAASAADLQASYPKTLRRNDPSIRFIASKVGDRGVAELERISTALYVKRKNPEMSIEARAQQLCHLKPHVPFPTACSASKEMEAIEQEARAR